MSKTGIIIVAILVTLGLTYGLSLLLTRRKTKTGGSVSADDWEVGGRELPLYVVVGTQFATAMGGGILVGQVGNGFNNGLSCLLYGILCQLAFIVLMFIANGCALTNSPPFRRSSHIIPAKVKPCASLPV